MFSATRVDRRSRALRAAVESVGLESLEGRRLFAVVTLTESQPAITNAPPSIFEQFGDKMDARDGVVVVGLPNANGGVGEARVFDANGILIATLNNPEPESDDAFGDVVSVIDSTHIAVRSVEGFSGDLDNPIIYIFDLNGDLNDPVIIGAPEDNDFGNSLAVVGGDLLISTPSYDSGQGGVYRFDVTGAPVNHATVDGPSNVYTIDGAGQFGQAMAADANGSTMLFSVGNGTGRTVVEMDADGDVVETYEENHDVMQSGSFAVAFNAGSVYVGDANLGRVTQFNRTNGDIVGEITDSALLFGGSVIANGDYVVIGAAMDMVNVYDDDFGDSANDAVATAGLPAGTIVDGLYNLDSSEFIVADPFAATDIDTPVAGKLYVFDLADIAPPSNSAPTANAGADQSAVRQQLVSFAGTGSDAEDGSNVAYAWDFNYDGVTFTADVSTQNASTSYATAGTYLVALRVTDQDGASTIDTLTVTVSSQSTVGGTLFVGGTNGTDTVLINGNTVTINGVSQSFTGGRVIVYGGPGADVIGVIGGAKSLEAHGGDGNDILSGGQGADILVGDGGNDIVSGAGGRDLLIGGSGADLVVGLAQDDILIAGSTVHDNNSANLANILSIWNGAGTYSNRVATLVAPGGALTPDSDVFDDNAVDILTGNAGTDWFLFNNTGDNAHDLVLDANSTEVQSDLDTLPS